ncbi:ParA family protein [Halobacterium hubeiense]|uniref:ParA family protein n=1 Tax=Halobacterium hubeiense TaxID=1407499 RepID=UPI003C7417FC
MGQTKRASTYLDKGGVGKSTATAHLGAALQDDGHDVLLVDLAGKQDDLGSIYGIHEAVREDIENDNDYPNVTTTMEENWTDIVDLVGGPEAALDELVYETDEGVDIIPAHPTLDALDGNLGQVDDPEERYGRLRKFFDDTVDETDRYDIILLDLPGLSNNVSYNGLWATQDVISPVLLGSLEIKQARALQRDATEIRREYDVDVQLQMLIANMFDRRTNLDETMLEELQEEFGDLVAPGVVPQSQAIKNTTARGCTLFDVDEDELSKTGLEAREAFRENAAELLTRLR